MAEKNRKTFWFYVKVIVLLALTGLCLADISRDVAVRSFGEQKIATVSEMKQTKADEFELQLTMSADTVVKRFERKISRKSLTKYGNITNLKVRYLAGLPNHIVCIDIDRRVWFRTMLALIGVAALLLGVVKGRI